MIAAPSSIVVPSPTQTLAVTSIVPIVLFLLQPLSSGLFVPLKVVAASQPRLEFALQASLHPQFELSPSLLPLW